MAKNVRLDHSGLSAILKSEAMHKFVEREAEKLADAVREQGITVGALEGPGETEMPVTVSMTTTDRAHASVALAHPAGIAVQAKHGALTRAANAVGLTVSDD